MKKSIILLMLLLSPAAFAVDTAWQAPDFSLQLLQSPSQNSRVTLQSYAGKVIYLDFWASWCGPCKKSFPALNSIRNKYKSRGFEVIAVNLDENIEDAVSFLQKHKVDYPVVFDPSKTIARTYQLKGMPSAYLIDRRGVIQLTHTGFKDRDIPMLENNIQRLLGVMP